MEASPKTRSNEIWKILLADFKTYLVTIAETKLELLIGPNTFFNVFNWDVMKFKIASPVSKGVDDAL